MSQDTYGLNPISDKTESKDEQLLFPISFDEIRMLLPEDMYLPIFLYEIDVDKENRKEKTSGLEEIVSLDDMSKGREFQSGLSRDKNSFEDVTDEISLYETIDEEAINEELIRLGYRLEERRSLIHAFTKNLMKLKIPRNEEIQYFTCSVISVVTDSEIKRKKRTGLLEVRTGYTWEYLLIITSNRVLGIKKEEYAEYMSTICFAKTQIELVRGVYVPITIENGDSDNRMLKCRIDSCHYLYSNSQVQVKLNDGRYFIIQKYCKDENTYKEGLGKIIGMMQK